MKGLTLFGPMFLLFFLGVPVAYAIGFSGIVYALITGDMSLSMIPQRMFAVIYNNYIYIAIPLFIFAGYVMEVGGISTRLFNWAKMIFPRLPGGVGTITLVTCAFFGAMTGSIIATCVAISAIAIPPMLQSGYTKERSAAIVAAGSILGPIIPPSITMIVYAATMSVSIPEMFIGSILPGILILIFLTVPQAFWVRKHKDTVTHESYTLAEKIRATGSTIGALLLPVIILGGIYGGIFTPTEAGCVSCIYAVFLSMYGYRSLGWADIMPIAIKTAKSTASIMIIIAFANVFTYLLSVSKIPAIIAKTLTPYFSDSPNWYLVALMLILLVAGCLLETTAIILILGPILVPIGVAIGLDPLHLGIAFCCSLILGYATPPFGMALFTVSGVAKVNFGSMAREIWPFLIAASIACLVIALVPQISLVMPDLMR